MENEFILLNKQSFLMWFSILIALPFAQRIPIDSSVSHILSFIALRRTPMKGNRNCNFN